MACAGCGHSVRAADRYCENCGAALRLRRTPEGGPEGPVAPGCTSCGAAVDAEGFCERCGRARATGRDRMEFDLGLIAGVSDLGKSRSRNEDSMAFAVVGPAGKPTAVVAVVCDGVGSTERADEASQTAVDTALETIVDGLLDGISPSRATLDGVAAACDRVNQLEPADSNALAPSCTLVSVVATATEISVSGIGDSRVYWLGPQSRQLTSDHTDPASQALTHWVGADAEPFIPPVTAHTPAGAGHLVLCSDGLWNYLPSADELSAAIPRGTPLAVAGELAAVALDSGGADNVTVVVLPYPFGEP